jgi:hypothetical protein
VPCHHSTTGRRRNRAPFSGMIFLGSSKCGIIIQAGVLRRPQAITRSPATPNVLRARSATHGDRAYNVLQIFGDVPCKRKGPKWMRACLDLHYWTDFLLPGCSCPMAAPPEYLQWAGSSWKAPHLLQERIAGRWARRACQKSAVSRDRHMQPLGILASVARVPRTLSLPPH